MTTRHIHTYLLPVLILALGMFLRIYHPLSSTINFDQVQILTHAERIASGDPTLIGPRTGPIDMYTGPLIYYLTALILLVVKSPLAIIGTSMISALLTGLVIWWLCRRYLFTLVGWFVLYLWAVSPFLISMDRITWNPNLTLLASSLVFFPLYWAASTNQRLAKLDLVALAAGNFFGYQAHFSGLFLPILTFLTWLIFLRHRTNILLAAAAGTVVSLLPTLIFDLRHHWLNARGFIRVLTVEKALDPPSWSNRLNTTFHISFESLGNLGLYGLSFNMMVVGVAVSFVYSVFILLRFKRWHRRDLFPVFWVTIVALTFSLYRGDLPEYYLMIQLPAWLLVWGFSLKYARRWLPLLVFIYLTITINSAGFVTQRYTKVNSMTFANIFAVQEYISGLSDPIAAIAYDIEPFNRFGIEYMFTNFKLADRGRTAHLIYPYVHGTPIEFYSNNLGVWVE